MLDIHLSQRIPTPASVHQPQAEENDLSARQYFTHNSLPKKPDAGLEVHF